eukprot:jgi/Antlo1/272/27
MQGKDKSKFCSMGHSENMNKAKDTSEDCEVLRKYFVKDMLTNKCMRMFFEAMKACITDADEEKTAWISSQIVAHIIKLGKIRDSKFVRCKLLNIKNRINPQLVQDIYNNAISPERFVEMSQEEMKSEDLKQKEDEMHKRCLLDMQVAKPLVESGMFECSRCKQRKCSYYQMQTRSADEPMTTYVQCVCGHRWKFS